MASGYITSDGKDLDERYLGIDAKAKSAAAVDWSAINNVPVLWPKLNWTAAISVSSKGSWTAPSDGVMLFWFTNTSSFTSAKVGSAVIKLTATSTATIKEFGCTTPIIVSSGDVISASASFNSITGTFVPAM